MKKLFTAFFLFFAIGLTMAQNTITGTIVDGDSGDPLIGASVLVKGTSTGTITDFDGNFKLQVAGKGDYVLVFSYTGYEDMEQNTSVAGDVDLGEIKLNFAAVGLKEIEVLASVAIDRKTPVAVTTLKGDEIEELVGNQEYVEVLRQAPSVYVTKAGGGFGDSRINVRGFDQRNTAVMINGVPVNDMENGWVYWSNWAGLSDVTSRMDYQRGLGASKLVVPSVGGSINIVTNAADFKKGGIVSASIGNDGYQKYGLAFSTGLSEKGFAFTFQGTHTRGNGYVEGTKFRAYSYFLSLTKEMNDNHSVSFTFLGAPQWHHQRFIPGRFDGVNLRTFVDPDKTGEAGTNRGIKYNWLWGMKDGQEFSWRRNFYHKPVAFFNHYWTISPSVDVKTSVYASWGTGGGTGPRGRINSPNGRIYDGSSKLRDADGHILWDDIVAYNQGGTSHSDDWGVKETEADGPFAGKYVGTRSGNGFIRRASMNNHSWYGIYSSLTAKINDNLSFIGGIDGRYYKGEHYRRLENLLGLDAYKSTSDDNNPERYLTTESPAEFGNFRDKSYLDEKDPNVLAYHNDGIVAWSGVFAQLEYSKDALSTFIALTGSNQGFKRIDYFNYLSTDAARETDWQNFLGGTVKAGLNYNINDQHNVFVNGGYFSRQPIFDDVFINFRNDVNDQAENQVVKAFELGYGFRAEGFKMKLNGYFTDWGNRQFDITDENGSGEEILYHFTKVNEVHSGIEAEVNYSPSRMFDIRGMFSIGNWEYGNDFTATGFNLDQNKEEGSLTVYANGVKVGDAAQTTAGLGLVIKPVEGLRIYSNWNYAAKIFGKYDVRDSQFLSPGGEVVELPAYSLLDAGISYRFELAGLDVTARFASNNVLDTEYVSEVNTNIKDDPDTTDRNEFYDNRGVFGFGRTWNGGVKIRF